MEMLKYVSLSISRIQLTKEFEQKNIKINANFC